jgi:hypothetical protein
MAGALAAVVAAPVTVVAGALEFRFFRRFDWQALLGVFTAVTGGLLWLGEEYGLVDDVYRDSTGGPLSLK